MTTDSLVALASLLLLAVSSLALGSWSGQRSPARLVAVGFLLTTALLVSLNLFLNFVGLQTGYFAGSFVIVALAVGLSWRSWIAQLKLLKLAAIQVLAAVVAAFVLIGLLHFRGAPSFDSTFVLSLSHLIQSGDPFWFATDYFKRGLAYPLLHAYTQFGHFNPQLTVFIAAILGLLAIEVLNQSLAKFNKRVVQMAYAATVLVTFSTPMIWNAALYIREHTLVALAVAVMFVSLVSTSADIVGDKDSKFVGSDFWAWMAASVVLASSRPEGVAIALIFVISAYGRFNRNQRIALAVAPVATVLLWMLNLRYESLPSWVLANPWSAAVVLAVFALAAWFERPAKFVRNQAQILFATVATLFALELVFFYPSLASGLHAQFVNLVLQEGGWGVFMVLAVLALVTSFFIRDFAISKTARFALGSLLVLFLIAKTLDLGILRGEPDLGRVGISDSLNRMWLHLLLPLTVCLYYGFVTLLQSVLSRLTKGKIN